jgi:hypothetical protein
MKKTFLTIFVMAGLLLLGGCGSNDFDGTDTNETNGTSVKEYSFFNANSPLTISQPDTHYEIKTQLLLDGKVSPAQTVNLLPFNSQNGSVSSYAVVTGTDGFARFDYTSPKNMPADGTSIALGITFVDEHNKTISTAFQLDFNTSSPNNSGETNSTLPTIVIPSSLKEIMLETNSKTVTIAIKAYKNIAPYTTGKVKVALPSKVLQGTDVGSFDAYEVELNDQGVAVFTYTGPSNLKALIDNNDTESVFQFYHEENFENKQSMKVKYKAPNNPYVSRNYLLNIVTSGEFSMGIPDVEKTFTVVLKAKDSSGNSVALSTETITKITATTTNSGVAQIMDTASNTLVNSLVLNAENNSPFILKSKTLSGLVPMEVEVVFVDINGDTQTLSTMVNVRVFSGPPSAISISYVGTGQDNERAKYIEKFAISVTDEYGNRVNTKPNITLGAIAGYAVDGQEASGVETNATRRLFYGKANVDSGTANGEVDALGDTNVKTTEFVDNTLARSDVFRYVNHEGNNTDKLVVFGNGKNYEAMGKWDIVLGGDNHTLTLQDNYFGANRQDLYYAVGHNYYQDQCTEAGREWIGNAESDTYQLDEEGTVLVSYKYDYHLTGKDVLVWVNLNGLQPDTGKKTRIGEVTKHTLRGTGLTSVPTSYTLEKGMHVIRKFSIHHENAPEWYRNAHFGYRITGDCSYKVALSTNWYDARTCSVSIPYTLTTDVIDDIVIQYPDINGTRITQLDYVVQNAGKDIAVSLTLRDDNGIVTGAAIDVIQPDGSVVIDEITNITDHNDGNYTFEIKQHSGSTTFNTMNKVEVKDGEVKYHVSATRTENYVLGSSGGVASVSFELTSSSDAGCTFGLEHIVVSDEF